MQIDFFVPGEPIPQGSKRNFGAGRMVDANPRLKGWRNALGFHAAIKMGRLGMSPITEACKVEIVFYLSRPKSVTRKYPSVKPDADKLARAVLDGLSINSKMLENDSLVVQLIVTKLYADEREPGAKITIITI